MEKKKRKRRTKKEIEAAKKVDRFPVDDTHVEVIDFVSPCDLANEELKQKYGNRVSITRELYIELSEYREIPKKPTRDWIYQLNELSLKIMKRMVSRSSIKSLCGNCGGARNTIESLHRPLMDVLKICDKHNPEIK